MARVLDLFCGAGGFSHGFREAGHEIVAGVDVEEDALATYDLNHEAPAINCDLAATDPSDFANEYDVPCESVDVVIGGPPCQGFSLANVSRSIDDERNNLVFVFAEYVDYYQPESFVMENVTGIETIDNGDIIERLYEDFEAAGYTVEHRTLNAANYGVPQTRERVFFIGVDEGEPQWPEQTHAHPSEL